MFCFVLSVVSLVMLFLYSNEVRLHGLFLDYAVRFLDSNPVNLLYLPVFAVLMLGLVALTVWQHCCFSSRFAYSNNFFSFNNSGAWEVLNIIEFIWGAQFLRDAYNFCLSGSATDYYWKEPKNTSCTGSLSRLVSSHWGSVVGGSFINAFFQ